MRGSSSRHFSACLYDTLIANGWTVIDETENMWLLVDENDPRCEPMPIPKHCEEVDSEIMDRVTHHAPGLTRAVMGAVRKHVSQPP